MIKKIPHVLACLLLLSACEKEENNNSNSLPLNMDGVFIVNEGSFQDANASVSFYADDGSSSNSDLYKDVNGIVLGDLLQSMSIFNEKAYLCVNNSQKVVVVNMDNFKRIGTITGMNSPRYFAGLNTGTGFVSDWASNSVYKINLSTNTIVDSISCNNGPEEMIVSDNRLFICNSGGFGDDSTVTVVDLSSFTVSNTIVTGINPTHIRKDSNGKLWVLCKGSLGSDYTPTPDDAGGSLIRINPQTLSIEASIPFSYDQHPIRLNITADGNTLYFLNSSSPYGGAVYRMGINENTVPASPLINREFYGLGIHPGNGNIYCGKAVFTSNTHLLRYDNSGNLIDSAEVGIGPNSFVFN
ncbi:MAG: YncE family protein [Bacteroidia bacterium]|nr:YncE family protein [Bacteroidia bacterium]